MQSQTLGSASELRSAGFRAAEVTHAIGLKEINLVMLNHGSPLMRYSAIRDGARFIERDHDERVRLETRAILDYLDTAPLRELASGS